MTQGLVTYRTKQGILADLAASYLSISGKDINDLNEGSVIRTLLEIIAEEHEETDYNIARAYYRTVLRYATGSDLDAIGSDEGVTRQSASGASGYIRLSSSIPAPSDTAIAPIGSIIVSNGLVTYKNSAACRIFTGSLNWVVDDGVWSNIDIPFEATSSGTASNSAAATIETVVTGPTLADECTNPLPFKGGKLNETDNDYRARIKMERDRRAGSTRIALLAEALRQKEIYSAAIYEYSVVPNDSKYARPSPGEVWAYVFPTFTTNDTFTAGRESDEGVYSYTINPQTLCERIRNALESVRGYPITLKVYEPYVALVNIDITVILPKSYRISDTTSAKAEILQRIRNFILSLKIGEALSEGHVYAIIGQVISFREITATFTINRNRAYAWLSTQDGGLINTEDDEILKPAGTIDTFGSITIKTEDE